jgi:competence protein ComEA
MFPKQNLNNVRTEFKEAKMKIFNSLLLVSLLCLLPATNIYAQLSEITQQIPQFEAISINKADASLLTKLPGIGNKKAEAIVEYRDKNGEFTSIDDLTKVKGIGKKLMTKLEGKVKL